MALTSTSGVVNGDDVVFSQASLRGAGRGTGIVAYFEYTDAAEETINIALSANDADIDENFYEICEIVAGDLVQVDFDLPLANGLYRFVLPNALNEDNVKLTITGFAGGSVNVEFQNNNPYK